MPIQPGLSNLEKLLPARIEDDLVLYAGTFRAEADVFSFNPAALGGGPFGEGFLLEKETPRWLSTCAQASSEVSRGCPRMAAWLSPN